MRRSKLFIKTLKEAPTDEVAKNAQLLIRAGYIHKEMAGVYVYTTLGLRVLEKIKQIIREEMDAAGGNEVMMTVLQPRELWEKTDRWDDRKVDNWFKSKLVSGSEVGIGLTHEEPIVDMMASYVSSYKDLPISIYQIQSKFRNEKRAKSGLLRGREFVMKDMYTLAKNQAEHDEIYEKIAAAYHRVYERLGIGDITFRVKADGGIFTSRYSDEFQMISSIGEDTLFHVPDTDIYINEEVASSLAPEHIQPADRIAMTEQHTPGVKGAGKLAETLGVPIERTVKTMLYRLDDKLTAVAVRGDYDVNEIKLRLATGVKKIELADEVSIREATGAEVGYAGLINLPDEVDIIIDDSVEPLVNFELGANRTDYHNINVNWDVDLARPEKFYDIKQAKLGDIHPETGKVYEIVRGVEVGNIFPLETKYTDALGVYYSDQSGKKQSIIMGCYGIGVSRVMGVLAEDFSDDKGLIWDKSIAPYSVYLVSIGKKGSEVADRLYEELTQVGIEMLYDDRDERPGKKFADAELMGIPYRLTVSDRGVEAGEYELVDRKSGETKNLTAEQLIDTLKISVNS